MPSATRSTARLWPSGAQSAPITPSASFRGVPPLAETTASVPLWTYAFPVSKRGRSTASSPERETESSSAPLSPSASSPALGRTWKTSRSLRSQSAERKIVSPSGAKRALTKWPVVGPQIAVHARRQCQGRTRCQRHVGARIAHERRKARERGNDRERGKHGRARVARHHRGTAHQRVRVDVVEIAVVGGVDGVADNLRTVVHVHQVVLADPRFLAGIVDADAAPAEESPARRNDGAGALEVQVRLREEHVVLDVAIHRAVGRTRGSGRPCVNAEQRRHQPNGSEDGRRTSSSAPVRNRLHARSLSESPRLQRPSPYRRPVAGSDAQSCRGCRK